MTRKFAVYVAALSLLPLFGLGTTGCKKEQPAVGTETAAATPKTPETPKTPPATPEAGGGLAKGEATLVKAAQAVLKSCEVSDYGYIRKCKDEETKKDLSKIEKKIGVAKALLTYCYGMGDSNHVVQALSAHRISRLAYSQRMREEADDGVYVCLKDALSKAKRAREARPLSRAVVYMGTALKKDDEVIKLIDASELDSVKTTGYNALWANGRLRVFDHLAKTIKEGKDDKVRVEAIRGIGLGERLNPEEEGKVCALLVPFMENDDLNIAAAAASRVGSYCPKDKDKVLGSAEGMIKKKKFDFTYVGALRSVKGYFSNKATPAQIKKIVALCQTVVAGTFSDLTRSSALRLVNDADAGEGQKIAQKYSKDGAKWVREAAEKILKKKK